MPREAVGLVAFEDAELAAGAEDAVDFGEAGGVVGEVAEAEGGGDEVEGVVGVGEVHGVAFDPEGVGGGELGAGAGEHFGGEVEAGDGFGDWRGGVLRSAAVRSPVPQQRSRTRASGRSRMGAKVRAVRFHQRRSRPKESRWLRRS